MSDYFDRIEAHLLDAVERQAGGRAKPWRGGPTREHRRRSRWLPAPSTVAMSVSASLAIAIVILAVALLGHGRTHSTTESVRPTGAAQLEAKLAVLRERQTRADRSGSRIGADLFHAVPISPGTIVPGLTRLVGAVRTGAAGNTRLFLVIATPASNASSRGLQTARGDLAYEIAVSRGGAGELGGDQAGALNQPQAVWTGFGIAESIVPDGVARVRWVFAGSHTSTPDTTTPHPRTTITLNVHRNAAISTWKLADGPLSQATWYSANGTVLASYTSKRNPSQSASRPYGVRCTSSQLWVTASRVSEATQQETRLLTFRNVSTTGCDMRGYPEIVLSARNGNVLPFRYRRGGDQMITSKPPALVSVPPGGTTYAAINKNSCVARELKTAAGISVVLPIDHRRMFKITLAPDPVLGYCGPGDPGHDVDISPIEPTAAAVSAAP